MPRRPRLQLCGVPLHVVQRSNNRLPCFFAEADLGKALAYEALFRSELDEDTLTAISASRRGGILGGERFREKIESAMGDRRTRSKAGRPKRGSGWIDGEQIDLGF